MKAIQRFKSYEVRIPKVIKEARLAELSLSPEEKLPEGAFEGRNYTSLDMTGSALSHEIKNAFDEAIDNAFDKITNFVSQVSEALSAAGLDTTVVSQLPSTEAVVAHVKANLDFPALLRDAYREAAASEWLAKNPSYAALIANPEATAKSDIQI